MGPKARSRRYRSVRGANARPEHMSEAPRPPVAHQKVRDIDFGRKRDESRRRQADTDGTQLANRFQIIDWGSRGATWPAVRPWRAVRASLIGGDYRDVCHRYQKS